MKTFKKRLSRFEEENHGVLKGIEGSLIRWMICGPTQNNRPYLENEKVLKLDKQNLSSA